MFGIDNLTLAAFLHDIGKFYQRAMLSKTGSFGKEHEKYSEDFIDDFSYLFENTGEIKDFLTNPCVKIADEISAAERIKIPEPPPPVHKVPLLSIFSIVEIGKGKPEEVYHDLNPLSLNKEVLFPQKGYQQLDYGELWNAFTQELNALSKQKRIHFDTFYHLANKYWWCIPSAVYAGRQESFIPDVSLLDHSRVAGAIARCLPKVESLWDLQQNKSKEVCCLIAADMAGIQNFILRVTQTEEGAPGVAKRLRARSFFLSILQEVIARYILRKLDLPILNLIYCGGGNFWILAPLGTQIDSLRKEINEWLCEQFMADIGFTLIIETLTGEDLEEEYPSEKIGQKLDEEKTRKFKDLLPFVDYRQIHRPCGSCEKMEVEPGTDLCRWCKIQTQIGECLPRIKAILFTPQKISIPQKDAISIDFDKFGQVILLTKDNYTWLPDNIRLECFKINNTENFWTGINANSPDISAGFKFITNIVPVDENQKVKDFNVIAKEGNEGESDKKIAILRMDVDDLGFVFSRGLRDYSFSRIAQLSRMLDLFFTGYIGRLLEQERYIYTVYSGGDDLFLIGPWDKIPDLAQKIQKEFSEYTGNNPNLTISASIFLCRPHFPVKRFAPLSKEKLEEAKTNTDYTKGVISIFNETVKWDRAVMNFSALLEFGKDLAKFVNEKYIHRGLLFTLLELCNQAVMEEKSKKIRCTYIPNIIYQLNRNVHNKDVFQKLYDRLIKCSPKDLRYYRIPLSYAILRTRESR